MADLYNVPYIVFSDEKITKMHDSLALKLFNPRVLLLSESYNASSFYSFLFPWTTMLISLNFENITFQDRIDLLGKYDKNFNEISNKNIYFGNMFHSQLLTDTRGTLISLLNFFFTHSEKVSISINRLLICIARYDDTINKFSIKWFWTKH